MARRETLLAWLRDAHAMERATIDNLQRQVERTDEYPQLQAKLEEHLDQSRDQLRRVEDCLHRLGTDPSMVKDAATRLTGYVETWLAGMAPDEIVKNCMATYAFEHFEVASYRALAAAAQECGELDVMRVCEEILDEYLRREAKAPANGGIARAGSMLREHPIPAAIAAAGLGFAIAAGSRGAFRRSGRRQSVQRRRAAMW